MSLREFNKGLDDAANGEFSKPGQSTEYYDGYRSVPNIEEPVRPQIPGPPGPERTYDMEPDTAAQQPRPLHVAGLQIRDFLGIAEIEITPGKATIIEGRNATGKSSILRALEAAIGGEVPLEPIRTGASTAEVLVELSDGRSIRKAITRRGAYLDLTDADGAKAARPQAILDALAGPLQFNPVSFVTAKKGERKKLLLAALNLELSDGLVAGWLGAFGSDEAVPKIIADAGDSVSAIQNLTAHFYARRGVANDTKRQKAKALDELAARIPADFAETPGDLAGELEKLGDLKEQQSWRARLEQDIAAKDGEIKAQDEKIAERVRALEEAKAELTRMVTAHKLLRDKLEKNPDKSSEIAAAAAVVEKLKANVDTVALCKMRDQVSGELQDAETAWAFLDDLVKLLQDRALDELLSTSKMPIEGLEIAGDEVRLHGVSLDGLSTSEKLKLGLEVSKALCGDLRLLCVDGAETLDPESFGVLVAEAESEESDLQMFVTRVGDGDLSIQTVGEA